MRNTLNRTETWFSNHFKHRNQWRKGPDLCSLLLFLYMVVFWNLFFKKLLFKSFLYLFVIEKLINEKHFPVKEKNLVWFLEKYFPEKFGWKTLSGSCEKFRNVILFADYIKFGPQTFDCYIYFILNIYFSISSLKI